MAEIGLSLLQLWQLWQFWQSPGSNSNFPIYIMIVSFIRASVPKIAKERTQENQRRIEAAALELFTSQGFHGTNNREIAQKVGVSTGTIYTYFPSKEAIFASLAQRYRLHMSEWLRKAIDALQDPLSKQGLKNLASAVQSLMYDDSESFLMLLSDVIEFKNQHFLEVFHDVPEQFRRLLGPLLEKVKEQPGWRGEDPAFVLASIHVYFFTFFLMERHMQGEEHLGISNELATEKFIDLLFRGLWSSPPDTPPASSPGKPREHLLRQQTLQAERDRVDYL